MIPLDVSVSTWKPRHMSTIRFFMYDQRERNTSRLSVCNVYPNFAFRCFGRPNMPKITCSCRLDPNLINIRLCGNQFHQGLFRVYPLSIMEYP